MPIGGAKVGFFGAGAGGNYWGDGSDGAFTSDGSDEQTVLNKNGSYDGDMLVRNYTSMTVSSGHTYTVDQPCRGMLIYVQGDCTIVGTLTMTAAGAFADPGIEWKEPKIKCFVTLLEDLTMHYQKRCVNL